MKFYNGQHTHYCDVDLHIKTLFLCIVDAQGTLVLSFSIERR